MRSLRSLKKIVLLAMFVLAFGVVGAFAQNVNVTASAGAPAATYTTLKGAFDAVNAGTHQGNIVMNVALSTTETAPAVLNSGDATPAAYTSILIQPSADGVTISGATATGRGLIELNGADNVTINGDNPNTGGANDRNLTITNTAANTVTYTSVIRIALAATVVNSANNDIFRNLILNGSATGRNISTATGTTASENTTFGIVLGSGASATTATTAPTAIATTTPTVGTGATAANLTIDNNAINSVARAVFIAGSAATVTTGLQITGNTLGNATAGATSGVYSYGIGIGGSTSPIVRANTIYVESFIGTTIRGIDIGTISSSVTTATIERNQVNRVTNSTPGGQAAFGILLAGGNTHTVRNNFVSGVINVANATFSTSFGAFGIRISSGTGHLIYHNSVNMYGNLTGTGAALTAAFVITSTTLTGIDARNNIFANTQTETLATTPASSAFVSISLPSGGTSAMNLTLNNNAYYFGTATNQGVAQVGATAGTTFFKTISELRDYSRTLSAAGTNDSNSFASSAPAPFISNTDLHIVPGSTTGLESGGAAVGVTTDIDNEARPNGTAPDIGADEFVGTFADQVAPIITYTPLPNTVSTANRTLTVTVTDNIGVTDVRIYFRKTGGAYASTQCTPSGGTAQNGTYTCTIDYSLIGGAVAGDVIEYFVVAQDAAGNVVSNPATGFTGTSTTNVTTPPTTPRSYTIAAAAFPTTVTVGTGGTYTSLTNAGGLFAALNAGVVTGNITVNIISDLTGETGAVALNPLTEEGAGAGTFTVTIKPSGAARTITGAAPFAIIRLNGADRVTIDGSLNGGTDRSLTITNTTTTGGGVVVIGSLGAGAGATSDTIKNCVLQAGTVGSTTVFTFGIYGGNASGAFNGPDNDNLTIQNNLFVRMRSGMQIIGDVSGQLDNLQIIDNTLGDAVTATNTIGRQGMNISLAVNPTISRNTITNISLGVADTGGNPFGIIFSSLTGGTISQNTIDGIRSLGAGSLSPFGILAQTSTGVSVSQNTVRNITTNATNPFGISLAFNLLNSTATRNNVTNIAYTGTAGFGGKGIDINTGNATSNLTVANNFVSDIRGDAFGTAFINDTIIGMRVTGTTGGVNLYNNSVNLGSGGFASTQTNTVTTALLVGASATALDVRNNIFANNLDNTTITTDKNYAIYSDAPATAYTTIDFNDYFVNSPQGVLGFIAALDRPTLADIQTGFGGNLNSKNVNPLFVSATDLHLQPTSTLINMGTPIAAVTDDIDGQARGTVPEIGADEVLQAGTVQFNPATYSVLENVAGGIVTVTVTRTGGSDGTITANYATVAGGGATATGGASCTTGVDYIDTSGTLTFVQGDTTESFTITICPDSDIEPDEVIAILLGGANVGAQNTAMVTIINDDFDTTAPTVVITQAAGQTDPTTAATVNFTVTFSEPVTGFGDVAGDVIIGGTAFGTGSTPSAVVTGSGTTYNVAVTGYNQSGTVIITIPAGAAQDAAGNQNTASNPAQGDNTVTVSFGTTLFVDDDGMAGAGNCDATTTAFTLIQAAIDASAAGNTIQVCPGVYNERLNISKSLTINGAQANVLAKPRTNAAAESTIVVDNSGVIPVNIQADNVTFNGFAFDINTTFPSTNGGADKPGAIIRANDNPGPGGDGFQNLSILFNRIIYSEAEVEIPFADRNGIVIAQSTNLLIEGNYLAGIPGQAVIAESGSTNFIYRNNDSFNSGTSVSTQGNFTRPAPQLKHFGVIITNNRFDRDDAILFQIEGGTISNNTFNGGQLGAAQIYLGGGDNNVSITGNTMAVSRLQGINSFDANFGYGPNSNINVTGNTFTRLISAVANGQNSATTGSIAILDFRGTGGTNTISNNTLRLTGTLPAPGGAFPTGNSSSAIRLRGSASGNFTITGNLLDGGGVTATGTTTPLVSGLTLISNAAAGGAAGNTGVFPAASVVNVNCNTFTRFQDGINFFDTANNTSGGLQNAANITITTNNIDRNSNFGINNAGTSATVNAENNYWGAANGPGLVGPGSGDRVTANVDFDPFLNAPPVCAPALLTSLTINDVTQLEGNSGTSNFVFTVTRTGDTTAATTVNFTTVDGTATAASGDYVATSGTLTFAAGQPTQTITVVVNGDMIIEPTETFMVRLSGATNGTVTDADGLGTITNDDFDTTPPTVVVTQAAGQADPTTATTVNFTVTFSEPVTGFGAQAGDVIVSGTAFATGSTPTVTVTGSGTTYNVAVSGYTQNGTVIINIPAGAAQDPANNNNLASNPAQGDNTITVFPGATTLYVDDDGQAGPGGCDTAVAGISNIQSAVNASASGNTIIVCPGTYAQNVTVDKPLTILGPNANIDPNTGTRVPEAILLTTVSNPVNNNCDFNTDSNIMTLTAANTVVRGFTFDGDNPALNSTFVFNGANIDAYSAVFQQNVNNPNADVSNNIVKNTSEFGIILGSNDNASARTNSVISRNRLDNIIGFCFGEAIRIGENAYANVSNNVVTRSFNGVTIENFNNSPTSRPTSVIGTNQITAYGFAIYHNLHYGYTGNGFTISNNRINSYIQVGARSTNAKALGAGDAPNGGGFDKFRGIMLESIQGLVPVTLNANEIIPDRVALIAANYSRVDGIYITNTSTDSPNILITGNQISRAFRGISHVAPAVPTLMCNAIAGNDVGLYVGTDTQFGGTPSSSTNGINVSQNNFTFNTAFGLQNDSSFTVVAKNNYWNSPSGPTTPANPGGTGDRVSPNVDFSPFSPTPTCGPTASGATVEGRVTVATGKGIVNTKLTLTDSAGRSLTVLTDKTGKFIFTEVPTGETYILTIHSKKYQFAEPTRVITVNENIDGINFVAY